MLKIRFSTKFKKDYKLTVIKRGYDQDLFRDVVAMLRAQTSLPKKYHDHALKDEYVGHRECHITPDWLLIYKIEQDILTLTLTRTGTHSDLF